MNPRTPLISLAIAALFAAPGLASASMAWHPTNGEAGAVFVPDHLNSMKSRDEVRRDALRAHRGEGLSQCLGTERRCDDRLFGPSPVVQPDQLRQSGVTPQGRSFSEQLYIGG